MKIFIQTFDKIVATYDVRKEKDHLVLYRQDPNTGFFCRVNNKYQTIDEIRQAMDDVAAKCGKQYLVNFQNMISFPKKAS